ncbi:MAG: hypothetical protein ACI88A_004537 [Paraglaciecola sp.]|jgi:hypothetical protein
MKRGLLFCGVPVSEVAVDHDLFQVPNLANKISNNNTDKFDQYLGEVFTILSQSKLL